VRARSPASTRSIADDLARLQRETDALERRRIEEALAACGGNQTHAARALGMSRGTLIKRLEKYAIVRPRRRQS
jgi:DNA-binding NtrC family response regulator